MGYDRKSAENEIRLIDSRVLVLEKMNDEWMAKHGDIHTGIYDLIQLLMDKRDKLSKLV